jgi:hypothetical protein
MESENLIHNRVQRQLFLYLYIRDRIAFMIYVHQNPNPKLIPKPPFETELATLLSLVMGSELTPS